MATVREATPADGGDIGRVQVETWQAAYVGLIPDDVLAALDPTARGEGWRRRLAAAAAAGDAIFVAEDGGAVIGFASVGPWRDDGDGAGELYALYVVPSHWGTGAGRALLERAEAWLRGSGFRVARLWVLAGNERAERFYRLAGWVDDGVEKIEVMYETPARERRYSKQLA